MAAPEQELEGLRAQQHANAGLKPSETTPLKVAKKQRLGSAGAAGLAPKGLDFEGAESQQGEPGLQQVHEVGLGVILSRWLQNIKYPL